MKAPLVIVTGTGTEIGKTVVACVIVEAWARTGKAVAGLKPIESGLASGAGDADALARAATFHVTHSPSPYLLADPVSPHLAARREGRTIDLGTISEWVAAIREGREGRTGADAVVLELPGGLFSPLTDTLTNADAVRALAPTRTLLVAPDRLGVLHDVIATVRAAHAGGIALDGIVLSAPAKPDPSTGSNADELSRVLGAPPVIAALPRAASHDLVPRLASALAKLSL